MHVPSGCAVVVQVLHETPGGVVELWRVPAALDFMSRLMIARDHALDTPQVCLSMYRFFTSMECRFYTAGVTVNVLSSTCSGQERCCGTACEMLCIPLLSCALHGCRV